VHKNQSTGVTAVSTPAVVAETPSPPAASPSTPPIPGEQEYQEALRHTLSSGPFYPRSWPYGKQPYWGRIFPPLQKAAAQGHAAAKAKVDHFNKYNLLKPKRK